jgi:hypothetical protein
MDSTPESVTGEHHPKVPPKVGFGRFKVKLPHSKLWRIALGVALLLGSLFWFLPLLGLWMLPLGIMVLAVDIPAAQRLSKWSVKKWQETQGCREKWRGWWRRDKKPRDLRNS